MITEKELTEVSLSPTKKDYYQIWNEIIDLAVKISSRWSPDSTNESDPGIVLLKALVAIADKLNYNLDKNILEAFMPSATQTESMRKLTEMMGYSMKYYQAATCKVVIKYDTTSAKQLEDYGKIYFPKYVNLKNEEEDINYVTWEDFTLQESEPSREVVALEGELIECETNTDNIISMVHLDDNHRYLLPETNVAENGIIVCNVSDADNALGDSNPWRQVDNLNTWLPGEKIFKFGFDSKENLPYIQFPEDISQLIEDGLRIKYVRTSGVTGNISAKTLSKLEPPALWSTDDSVSDLTSGNFIVTNLSATTNGANPEGINAAYNNFKKTVGTFDTLVTCRDYMNKIYQLTVSSTDNTPLVSNVIVSDVRDDINSAATLCSFNDYGICYIDTPLPDPNNDSVNKIEHFDLVLYPFKTVYGLNDKNEYINSFRFNAENYNRITHDLKTEKTIAHNIILPNGNDIACIKNYLKLKADITTVKKVTAAEEAEILSKIYKAIYENFNCHKLDFGEKIPSEVIEEVIKTADPRIKSANLAEPMLYTKFMLADNTEYELVATESNGSRSAFTTSDQLYNKLVLRNILAGKIAAFQYDDDFKTDYAETGYYEANEIGGAISNRYPLTDTYITGISTEYKIQQTNKEVTLGPNEVVQFRMPNLKTIATYPCYVNYFAHFELDDENSADAINVPATFMTLYDFMNTKSTWEDFANNRGRSKIEPVAEGEITTADQYKSFFKSYSGMLFTHTTTPEDYYTACSPDFVATEKSEFSSQATYYKLILDTSSFGAFSSYIRSLERNGVQLKGLYRSLGADLKTSYGSLVDIDYVKYSLSSIHSNLNKPLLNYFVQETHLNDPEDSKLNVNYTQDGLGKDGEPMGVAKDTEYELGENEYILFNWTDSQQDASGNETKTVVNKVYKEGDIIKPNFNLIDSTLYHNQAHSYSKTSGYNFRDYKIPGMFTLGSDEQICIRDIVKVELDNKGSYLYWIRNDEDPEAASHIFSFNEYYNGGIPTDEAAYANGDFEGNHAGYKPNAYVLKEGEQLYYTDSKKLDLIYYGAGTLIVKHANTPTLKKNTIDGIVSAEDIVSNGLNVIPWGNAYDLRKYTVTDNTTLEESTHDGSITIIENKYVNLTEGDVLVALSTTGTDASTIDHDLNNDWIDIKSAKFRYAESKENGAPEALPIINIGKKDGICWKARSRLDINLNADNAQKLTGYYLNTETYYGDTIKVLFKSRVNNEASYWTLRPNSLDNPMAVYSNYPLQIASDYLEIGADISNAIDLKIKLAKVENIMWEVADSDERYELTLNNYINEDTTYTKFSFEEAELKTSAMYTDPEHPNDYPDYSLNNEQVLSKLANEDPLFGLNINIGTTDKCGIILFYYIDELAGTATHHNARLEVENGNIKPFNNLEALNNQTTYTLKPGVQVLELSNTVTKLKIYADYDEALDTSVTPSILDLGKSHQGIVIFGDLRLIKDINPKLNYRYNRTGAGTAEDPNTGYGQLLKDIRSLGSLVSDNFYYNVPISNSNAIDLNSSLDTDTLASPESWYDPNNVNNKFVISEIDSDYLSRGITLTRASKLSK